MIASSGVKSVTKVTQTDWDLSSSITGTVKRRPTSLESCKSNSPVDKNDANIDFPTEKQSNDNAKDRSSCNINKVNKLNDDNDDLSPEIEEGNVVKRKKVVDEVKKIDSTSLKKKFESARKSFSSKLKLPNSLSHLSPSRRSLPNKLSLSQLERQNNLFIRDGQQQQQPSTSRATAVVHDNNKINKPGSNSKNNTIILGVMAEENAGSTNPPKSKKSLIPSFLSTTSSASNLAKSNSNHIKIQSASTSIKKAPNVVEKLTKTGNKFRELVREKQQTNLNRNPPPYRPPPTPSPPINFNSQNKQKKNRLIENVARNYEEIDVIVEENVQEIEGNNESISTASTITQAIIHNADISDSNIDNMLAKAEYTSNVFKNIPVRPRKGGAVSHMENYCLFDPSVDFCNEKELMKKALTQSKIPIEMAQKFPFNIENEEEKIEDITFEDQTVYDITEHDERVAHHNYYEIDPELLEKEEPINVDKKSKMMSSSDSTSTSNSSANSSSTTTSSSDYPSLFNSVIETTHSSNVESTDDNDSNGYGKCQAPKINQQNLSNESIITVQNVVTACDALNGAKGKKKGPQLDRIIQAGPSTSTGVGRNKQYPLTKTKSSKTNKISSQLDSLKQSHSLPQLQNVIVQNKCRQVRNSDKNEINFVIDNTTTIQLRRPRSSRQQGRPLSTTSDDRDSGFLSPATPPDCAQNVIEQGGGSGCNIKDSTMLNQCDNIAIQQLIEVSHIDFIYRVTCVHKGVLWPMSRRFKL